MYLINLSKFKIEDRPKAFALLEKKNLNLENVKEKDLYLFFEIVEPENPYEDGFLDMNFIKPNNINIFSVNSTFDFPTKKYYTGRNSRYTFSDCICMDSLAELRLRLKKIFKDKRSTLSKCVDEIEELVKTHNGVTVNNHFTMTYPTFVGGTELHINFNSSDKEEILKKATAIFDKYKKDIKISFEDELKEHKVEDFIDTNKNFIIFGLILEGTSNKKNSIQDFLQRIA